jgi:hypothetical protein
MSISASDRNAHHQSLAAGEQGQGLLEYVLILSFALGISLALSRGVGSVVNRSILLFGGQLEKDLKTGRTPVAVGWKN